MAGAKRRTSGKGKSSEFSGKRNVNKGNFKTGTTTASAQGKLGASRVKSPVPNLGNTYGITARGGGASSGGPAANAGRGNSLFGSGNASQGAGARVPRRSGRGR